MAYEALIRETRQFAAQRREEEQLEAEKHAHTKALADLHSALLRIYATLEHCRLGGKWEDRDEKCYRELMMAGLEVFGVGPVE